jgi:hypothetical protein
MIRALGLVVVLGSFLTTGCDGDDGPTLSGGAKQITAQELRQTCGNGGVAGTMPCAMDQVR